MEHIENKIHSFLRYNWYCCHSIAKSCPTLYYLMDLSTPSLPHPSLPPGVCPNSCPLSQWCYPTISSSVILVSSCLQSFPASGSFPMSQFFTSGGQSIGASPSASVLSRNKSGLISFRMDWLDLLAAQWTLKESSPAPQFEGINSLALRPLYGPTLTSIHDYWKNHSSD